MKHHIAGSIPTTSGIESVFLVVKHLHHFLKPSILVLHIYE